MAVILLVEDDVSLAGDMNGLDVCRTLRTEPGNVTTPIVMLSGWALDTDIKAGHARAAPVLTPATRVAATLGGLSRKPSPRVQRLRGSAAAPS